jgi:hypothetical protein
MLILCAINIYFTFVEMCFKYCPLYNLMNFLIYTVIQYYLESFIKTVNKIKNFNESITIFLSF